MLLLFSPPGWLGCQGGLSLCIGKHSRWKWKRVKSSNFFYQKMKYSKKSFSWLFEIPLHIRDHLGLLFTSSECISAKLGRWSCHFLNAFFKATFSESAASPLLLSSLLSLSSSPSPCKTFVISGSLKTNHILLDSKCGCLEEQPKNLWEAIY